MKARKKVKLKHVESEKDLSITVRRIADRWHIRLLDADKQVIDEMACNLRVDITYTCREILRWYDKCGGVSKLAMAARNRQNTPLPIGKIYYAKDLKLNWKKGVQND